MSITVSITVTNVLWDDARRAGESLERGLRKADVSSTALAGLDGMGTASHRVLDQRISDALRSATDIDLGGVLIAAWTGYRALRRAATETRDTPGQPVDVTLAEHEITSAHQPVVEIQVNGSTVKRLTFELVLVLKVRTVTAVVDAGKLIAVGGGKVLAEARLELDGAVLAQGEHRCLAGAVVRLGEGIPLVGPSPGGQPTAPPTPAPQTATPPTAAPPSPAPSWVQRVPAPAAPAGTATWWQRLNRDEDSG